jgi:predicted nucleic acid-binding protein
MTIKTAKAVYWDSSVFISWINNLPDRTPRIREQWHQVTQLNQGVIVTSTLSIVEVANAAHEKLRHKLDPTVEAHLDNLWADPAILLVEASSPVMRMARKLMRDAIPHGWVLKPFDAVHLATAQFVQLNGRLLGAVNTYDNLARYEPMIHIPIREP